MSKGPATCPDEGSAGDVDRASQIPERISCSIDAPFAAWLKDSGGAVLVSTYQAGKLALAGWAGDAASVLFRDLDRPMGMAIDDERLAIAMRDTIGIWSSCRTLARHHPDDPHKHDALLVPRSLHYTGPLRTHDLGFDGNGELWFVNTLFSCLGTLDHTHTYVPRWRPPFISDLAPEDRCHLNGLAMRGGNPAFATALGDCDTPDGWRDRRAQGGVLIDVASGSIVIRGLSMPHSPHWQNGSLWFLNSGTGELCVGSPEQGRFTPVCGMPGFLRGLAFAGDYALVGLCKIREKHLFGGLPVSTTFQRLLCGVALIDVRRGVHVGTLEFTSGCHEMYDVQFLPQAQQPLFRTPSDRSEHSLVTTPQYGWFLGNE